jgi:hypothetical protein
MANGLAPVSALAIPPSANVPANAAPTANATGFATCLLDILISYLWFDTQAGHFSMASPGYLFSVMQAPA